MLVGVKTALLLDSSFSSQPLVRVLKELCIDVVVVGRRRDDALALGACRYVCADYSDKAVLLSVVKQIQPDYVVPGCNDVSYENYCAITNLLGTSQKATDSDTVISYLHNKELFRQLCKQEQIASPLVFANPATITRDDFPVIVKPVDGFSGKGICVVTEHSELTNAIREAEAVSRIGHSIVEQWVSGPLYSYSAFLSRGKISFGFLVREFCYANPFAVDCSFLVVDRDLEAKIMRELQKLISALNLQEGLLHTQFVNGDTGIYLIEVTRRCPGDLYSNLVQLSTGFDYAAAYVFPFVGLPLRTYQLSDSKTVFRHTVTANKEGYLEGFRIDNQARLEALTPVLKSGELIRAGQNLRAAVGFFRAETPADVDYVLAQAQQRKLIAVECCEK